MTGRRWARAVGTPMLLVAAAAAFGCASHSELEPRFVAIHNALSAMGLAQTGPISEGTLAPGGQANLVTELAPGRCYTFVALGESSVQDLDLRVFDETKREVGRDTTHDRQAAAQVCPGSRGDYQVVVEMASGYGGYILSSWSETARTPSATVAHQREGAGSGTCTAPIELPVGKEIRGETGDGQSAMQGSCVRGSAPEKVYRVQVEQRAQLTATLQSGYDGALYLLQDCGDVGTQLACNDDAGPRETSRSQVDASLDPGTYFLVVDGYGNESGSYQLIASLAELQELGAVCEDATVLQSGQPVTGATTGAPDYFQASCGGSAQAPDRVHRIDVSQRSRLRIQQETDYDGALYVRSSCDDASSELACNDDFRNRRHSLVTLMVEPGRYFVYSDGYSGRGQKHSGNFNLTAELGPDVGSGVGGDGCGDPKLLVPGSQLEIDTFAARDELRGSCGGRGAPDLVHRVQVPVRSRLRARISESEFGGVVYLRRRCEQEGSEVACAEIPQSAPRDTEGTLEATVSPGTYYLVVDGQSPSAFGAAKLELELENLDALGRACRAAPQLRPGRPMRGSTRGEDNDFQASCAGTADSPDTVYRVVIQRRSKVTIDLQSEYDAALHLRSDCVDRSSELACNDDYQNNRRARIEKVLGSGTYYLIVDGFRTGNAGEFTLELDVARFETP